MHLASALANAQLLRESVYLRDYLGKLIEEVNAPIAVVGPDRVVRVVNKAMERLTDRSREEVLGRDFVSVLPEAERARLVPHVLCALEGRATGEIEIKLPRKGGRYARATFSTTPILSSDHEVEGVIAIGRDLTELHALQEQVIQSEKLATLGQLAAGVVHELNNPLTSIRAYSEHLIRKFERGGEAGDDVEKLRRILDGADRILRFTSDLTSYAHPATEEPALLSINEVIEQSLVFCEHVIRDAGVEVRREFGRNLAPIRGIKAQLHQVFINLVTNACHACENRHGRISIRTIDAGTDRLRVVLTDNGVGIAEEQIVAIFEPFYSTHQDGKGTGLGLSIVRRILDSHGAAIRVSSALGEGSTFEVTLPACASRPADPG
jgi:PAS domain S-box-containing protein